MPTALVTGPTSGIGNGFARGLAADGHDLILVSRDSARLEHLASELRRVGVSVEVIVADLSRTEDLASVETRLRNSSHPVDVLVNNAGFGLNQRFVGGDVALEQAAIDVMITAVMRLTHAVSPGMEQRRSGVIINVASAAGFAPFGSYSALKAWVVFFTQGLANQFLGTGVHVVAVCPGFVRTEFHQRAGIKMSSNDRLWLSVDEVVDEAFKDLRRGKVVSVAGRQYKALAMLMHVVPRETARRLERLRRSRLVR